MSIKTITGYAALAFLVWWVVRTPASAEHLVANIGNWLSASARALSRFASTT